MQLFSADATIFFKKNFTFFFDPQNIKKVWNFLIFEVVKLCRLKKYLKWYNSIPLQCTPSLLLGVVYIGNSNIFYKIFQVDLKISGWLQPQLQQQLLNGIHLRKMLKLLNYTEFFGEPRDLSKPKKLILLGIYYLTYNISEIQTSFTVKLRVLTHLV